MSLIFWFAAVVCAALIFAGCESPTNGDAGAPGVIYLSGPQTSAGIQAAVDSGAPLVFAGVTQSDDGFVIVPAGRNVTLVGSDAYAVYDSGTGGFLILADAASVSGAGKIAGGTAGVVIAEQAVLDGNVTGDKKVAYTAISGAGALAFTGGIAAVKGDVAVGGTAGAGTIIPATLGGNTLFVLDGNLAVSADISGAATLYVKGNASVSVTPTGNVNWNVQGTLTATAAPTTGSGSVHAGALDVMNATGNAINLAGTVAVDELKTVAAVVITTDTTTALKAGTVTGTATFANGAKIGAAAFAGEVKFNGAAELGEVSFGGDVTVTNAQAITLTDEEAVTLGAGKSIKIDDTAAITVLTAGTDGAVLTPGGATTLTPTKTSKSLTLGAQALTLTSGTLTVAAETELALGKILTLAAGAELAVAGEVSVTVTDGGLTLSAAAGDGGAKLSGAGKVTAGSTEISGPWQAVGNSGTVAITYATTITTITGATLTAGTGAIITQKAGTASNSLVIAAGTTIDLGGTDTAVGSIVLTGAAANPGEIKFAHASTSIVKTGQTAGSSAFGTAAKIGGKTFGGDSSKAAIYTTADGGTGKLAKILGGTADYVLTGGSTDADTITINSAQDVTA